MHRAWARILFTIGSFVPALGIFGLVAWMIVSFGRVGVAHRAVELDQLVVLFGGSVLIAIWQMAMAIVVAIHTSGRKDMSSGAKAGWTLGCLFIGSIVLPVFSFVVLSYAARAHAAAHAMPPRATSPFGPP